MELEVQGRKAYAYTGGRPFDPALPSVVFIHGALHDHSVWTLMSRWFAHHGHSVLAVDLPGHARTGGAVLPDVEALADWTLALIDAAGARDVILVGHSMGSVIALEAASRGGDRIKKLVMVGTAYPMKVSPGLLQMAQERPQQAIDMVNAYSHATLASKPSYPSPGSWVHGANLALMRRVQAAQRDTNLFAHDFGVCDRYANGFEAARKVKVPSYLILGEHDLMTVPKGAKEIATALSATVTILPAGHALMQEVPEAVLKTFERLI